MRARLPHCVVQFLHQRATIAAGTIKLDGGMGDMKFVCQLMFYLVEQISPRNNIF